MEKSLQAGAKSYCIFDALRMYNIALAPTWPFIICQIFYLKFAIFFESPALFPYSAPGKPVFGGVCLFLNVKVFGCLMSSFFMGSEKFMILEII